MPGFGHAPFGAGFFGEWWWEEHVLWQDIPERRRARDSADQGGEDFMRRFVDCLVPSVRGLRQSIRDLFDLRDPWTCRSRYTGAVDVVVASVEEHSPDSVDPAERWTSVYLAGAPVEACGRSWVIESKDVSFRRWLIERVYKLDSDPAVASPNWRVVVPGTEEPPSVGATYSLHPQEQLPLLAADYGEPLDQYFDEARQRSQVVHHDQRRMWKGTETGYLNVARLYGFTITLLHLWRVRCGFESTIPPLGHEVYEIPPGSGLYYTGWVPRRPLYDEVAADAIPADSFCDDPAFLAAIPLGPFPVASATAFSSPYQGWDVIVTAPAGAFDTVAWPGHWNVKVSSGGTTYSYYLEAPPAYLGAMAWRLTVSGAGPAPSGGILVEYDCPVWLDCCWCGTSKISVELRYDPAVPLTDRERLYVFERAVDALYDVKPAHVEFSRFALVVEASASTALRALLRKGLARRFVAGTGHLYDLIEGDAVPADSYGLTAILTK